MKSMMPKRKTKSATANIYAVVGSDEAEVKQTAAGLAQELTPPDSGDFGLEIIDGCADNTDQAVARIAATIEALRTLPFFGSKLVWLKNANFLGDTVMGRSASVLSALEGLSETIRDSAPEIVFLLSAPDIDKRRSFYKMLGKEAELQVFDRLDSNRSGWEEEAAELTRRRADEHGLRFDSGALELFVLLTGGDTRQIENELQKIDIYLGQEREIRTDHVRELVPLSRAGVVFEIGNVLAERDLTRALKLIRQLLDQGETAIGILLAAILPTIRNLLLTKDLMERHRLPRPHAPFHFISTLNRLPEQATKHLPRKKDGAISGYALGIAAMNAHRFQLDDLKQGMESCLEANLRLVTTQLDHELVLTEVVVKLLGRD